MNKIAAMTAFAMVPNFASFQNRITRIWDTKIAVSPTTHHSLNFISINSAEVKQSKHAVNHRIPKGFEMDWVNCFTGRMLNAFTKPITCIAPCRIKRIINTVFIGSYFYGVFSRMIPQPVNNRPIENME